MTTTPTWLGLPPVTLRDSIEIDQQVDQAASAIWQSIASVRTLLQQRDLLSQWDNDAADFVPEFLPIAEKFHALQRALLAIEGGEFSWTHSLDTWVEAQR